MFMSEDGISRARAFLRISCLIVRVSCIVAYFVLDTSPREPRLRSGSHPYTRTYTLTHTTHSGVHTYTHTTHSGQDCFTWPRVITGLSRYLSPPPFCHSAFTPSSSSWGFIFEANNCLFSLKCYTLVCANECMNEYAYVLMYLCTCACMQARM